jgi:hypothetical protein
LFSIIVCLRSHYSIEIIAVLTKRGRTLAIGAPRHHHRNAGFIRQQHAPVAHLSDKSGVPRGHGIVHWAAASGCAWPVPANPTSLAAQK